MQDFPTLLDLAGALRAKRISPVEVLDETLARIERYNPALNAVIFLNTDDARRRARAAADAIANGGDLPPYLGVPVAIKDLTPVAGWPISYGSRGTRDEPSAESDLIVEAFERDGMVLCGRTTSPEFGTITSTETLRWGITRNPWNTGHTPGGSSGGAAAATAAGIFAIGHGGDGGGSLRIPASCTGLVGLKCSRSRVPGRHIDWEGAAVQGAVTRTVADTAAVLDLASRLDPLGWYNAPRPERPFLDEVGRDPGKLRVAVLTDSPLGVPVDPECVAAVGKTLSALDAAGHTIVDAKLEVFMEEFFAGFVSVVNSGYAGFEGVDWDLVEPYNKFARETALRLSSLDYVAAQAALQSWTRKFNAQFGEEFDVLVTPTMPIQPPLAGQVRAEVDAEPEGVSETVVASVSFTAIFNMNGLPAVSLPLHQATDSGLPIGVQVVAPPLRDDLLIRVASQLEQALPWADRHPDLLALRV